jgi:Calcium-activated chloride channel
VKDYYGERIGIYFLYLQHYVTLLIIPAFLGLVTYIGTYGRTFSSYYHHVFVHILSFFYSPMFSFRYLSVFFSLVFFPFYLHSPPLFFLLPLLTPLHLLLPSHSPLLPSPFLPLLQFELHTATLRTSSCPTSRCL